VNDVILLTMEHFNLLNVLYYCIFSTLVFYQQLHLKNFRGASKTFQFILSLFATLGMLIGFVFLIYYGYKVVWWAALMLFVVKLVFMLFAVLLERFTGVFFFSLLGFFVWPVCAYLMFKSIP
jgi:hypothetical protein